MPAFAFGFSTWDNWRKLQAQTLEREDRALDVLHEQSLNALLTVERSISEINEVLRGLTDQDIRQREDELYLRFKRTQQALPQIESIWAFAADGTPLVSSTIFPVPQNLNNSDRSYFAAQKEKDAGTFISEVLRARVGSMQFFVVSGRRQGNPPGTFNGVIGVTVSPSYFTEFYAKLSRGDDNFAIVRPDGRFLARYPGTGGKDFDSGPKEFLDALADDPQRGRFIINSRIDGVERLISYRKVASLPLYAVTGVETRSIDRELWRIILMQLSIGVPVTVLIFGMALFALRRAQRFEEESARRAAAEEAMKQSQRLEAIGQLTGGVAHDFNNLLMVINGSSERIKRIAAGNDRIQRAVGAIEQAVARGSALTRQLLSFARRQAHETEVIDLKERLPLLNDMLQPTLRGDIAITVHASPDVWKIDVDESEFELALINLAVNAQDAMPDGGSLSITAVNELLEGERPDGLTGEFVCVRVADTGTGIPADKLSRVFEPFFTTKEIGKGTGLGLSQVYGFAKQSGGIATIESKEGIGTAVSILLPRARREKMPTHVSSAPQMPATASGRVLVVEDNPDIANLVCLFLQELGYSVEHRGDVHSAIQLLERRPLDFVLVISDIVMPGGRSGLDLAQWIRREIGRDLPIVLASGYSDRIGAAAAEGITLLRKPFALHDLIAAIRAASRKNAFQ